MSRAPSTSNEPIRVRQMSLQIAGAGRPNVPTMPPAIDGSLAFLDTVVGDTAAAPGPAPGLGVPPLPGGPGPLGRQPAPAPRLPEPVSVGTVILWMTVVPLAAAGIAGAAAWRRRPRAFRPAQ